MKDTFSPSTEELPYDATQRVVIDPNSSAQGRERQPGEARSRERAAAAKKAKKKKITTIALISGAAAILIGLIITCIVLFSAPADNGLILNNVYVAGVNLGGKTPEQAKVLLQEATENTYSQLDMVVDVHDTNLVLTPDKTKVYLDVDQAVKAAYQYGRTGTRAERLKAKNQAQTSSHVVSIVPYLNLDTDYILGMISEVGKKYSSTLTESTWRITGKAPDMTNVYENVNPNTTFQTLYIKLGTPEYGLDEDNLYEQILDAYNTNIFHVAGKITVIAPQAVDLEALFAQYCTAPEDAVLDEISYEVTPGRYGYGFYIDKVREQLEQSEYGEEVAIPMGYLRPNITEAEMKDGLFETVLGTFTTPATVDGNLINNLRLVCEILNKRIIKADEVFSFNTVIGKPTEEKGYLPVSTYLSFLPQDVIGGGISQAASALYYCALRSDLTIVERHNHIYAPTFIEPGLDADVVHGQKDLCFKNTTGRPIRIEASIGNNGAVKISILGTENKDYTTSIVYETIATYTPETLTSTLTPDNPDEYVDGDILVQPIIGYDVCSYKIYQYSNSQGEPEKKLVAFSHYAKKDLVIVKIQETASNPDDDQNENNGTGSGSESESNTQQDQNGSENP